MRPFLKEVAREIIEKYNRQIPSLCFVFPNKRAGVFFRKYYGETKGKTTWSPDCFTIQEMIQKFTQIKLADKLSLLFELHRSYIDVKNKQETTFTFDRFYHLGEIILNDLNEIDSYLVDVNQLFSNLSDLKQIDTRFDFFTEEQKQILKNFWKNFSEKDLSKEKEYFIELWKSLPTIYEHFTLKLKNQSIGYEGLIYRQLIENIENGKFRYGKYNGFVFIGFNALNHAEERLFEFLYKQKRAKFYWDADDYYIKDECQEAGFFMRKNIRSYGSQWPFNDFPQHLNSKDKKVTLIGVPQEVGQAKALETLFDEYNLAGNNDSDLEKTAILLSEEHMLFPVLHSIPQDIKKINVTMGYPLVATPLYALLEQYLNLQRSLKINRREKPVYYHKDVIEILRHPDVWYKNTEKATEIIHHLEENNIVYIDVPYLLSHEYELYDLLFLPVETGAQLFTNILNLLFILYTHDKDDSLPDEEKNYTLEDEYIYQVYVNIKRLKEILEIQSQKNPDNFNLEITTKLITQLLSSVRIPFTGEPLLGLQVMGVLETRNLDFENIVILDMNEGIWPNVNRSISFIPENLRFLYGLTTFTHQDAIFAYYFYRFIQRAKNIFILYNNVTANNMSGEMSRYLKQIIHESGLNIEQKIFKQQLSLSEPTSIVVEKNTEILAKLSKYLFTDNKPPEKNFSASALGNYFDCSLRFYFRYIAEIKEVQTIEEEISPVAFGNILHYTVESIYNDIKQEKETINKSDFKNLDKHIDKHILKAFKRQLQTGQEKKFTFQGNQLIIKEVIKRHVQDVLRVDKKFAPFKIINLEDEFRFLSWIDFERDNKRQLAGLSALIDRVDFKEGIYRILDYKTGQVKKSFSSLENLIEGANRNRHLFQLFFYSYIFRRIKAFKNKPVKPVIYNIREMGKNDFVPDIFFSKNSSHKAKIDEKNLPEFLNEFENSLREKISALFNPAIPFVQTQYENTCKFCPYKVICKR